MQSESASWVNPFVLKEKAELDPDSLRPAGEGWTLKGILQGQRRIKQFLWAKNKLLPTYRGKDQILRLSQMLKSHYIQRLRAKHF